LATGVFSRLISRSGFQIAMANILSSAYALPVRKSGDRVKAQASLSQKLLGH
jgi:hypothetical protein